MINIKKEWEINLLRKSGKILAKAHQLLAEKSVPGVKLCDLAQLVEKFILECDASVPFKNYNGFPACICASVNDILIHGVPNEYVLKEGDIISYDVGVRYKKYITDAAFTMGIGKISSADEKLITITKQSLEAAIKNVKDQYSLNNLAKTVFNVINKAGFYTPKEYAGHGVGTSLHEPPLVLNYPVSYQLPQLKTNMVIAIEPMVLQESAEIEVLSDGFSVRSAARKNCAHFEHTIVVQDDGCEILTTL